MKSRLEIAKALSSLKRECQKAIETGKALNIRTIINAIKAIGVNIEETETFETIETGKTPNGNPFSRHTKNGKGFKFQLNNETYSYNSLQKYSAYSLTCNLAKLNALEIARTF